MWYTLNRKENTMNKYRVIVPVEGVEITEIEADNANDARQRVLDGEGDLFERDLSIVDNDYDNWGVTTV
jgi:hypothetical protein